MKAALTAGGGTWTFSTHTWLALSTGTKMGVLVHTGFSCVCRLQSGPVPFPCESRKLGGLSACFAAHTGDECSHSPSAYMLLLLAGITVRMSSTRGIRCVPQLYMSGLDSCSILLPLPVIILSSIICHLAAQ